MRDTLGGGGREPRSGVRSLNASGLRRRTFTGQSGFERRTAGELIKHEDMSTGWPAGAKQSSSFVYWLPSVRQLGSRFYLHSTDG